MNGSHIAGTGFGAALGVALAALGTRIGLHLDDSTSAMVGVGCASAGLAIGHAVGKAWSGIGLFPSIRRGLFGGKTQQPAASVGPLNAVSPVQTDVPGQEVSDAPMTAAGTPQSVAP